MRAITMASIVAIIPFTTSAANWWEEMDYGPFLSATFVDTTGRGSLDVPERLAANKGIAVKLGPRGDAGLIMDTELLRVTGGWAGGWLKLNGVVFDGSHGPNPSAADHAVVYFGTHANAPGWSKGEEFADPRPLSRGPRKWEVTPGAAYYAEAPFGPLPRTWAKYQGLYVSGSRVVFAYTVGQAKLFESPNLDMVRGQALISRTFNVLAAGTASSLLLADSPNGYVPTIERGKAIFSTDPLHLGDCTVVGVVGQPEGSRLVIDGTRLTLKLPPFAVGQKFKVAFAHGNRADLARLEAAIESAAQPEDLQQFTYGGPPRWPETVKVKGTLGIAHGGDTSAPFSYVVDNLSVPLENPYKSRIRIGGFDFFEDGRIAFCTLNGDVWIGAGIDEKLENIEWRRFATGLFQPLGLKIVDDQVYVLGRDQITRLYDLDGNGEADFYENFNNDVQVTPAYHEFTFGLETDSKGNFYFAKGGPVNPNGRGWGPLSDHSGCVCKVSRDGREFEVFAPGVRSPNGIGVGPNDEITIADNHGAWAPADYIHYVKEGEFIEVPDLAHREPMPMSYSRHLCWIPRDLDNSGGAQVWVTSDKWGPLQGSMLYLSYGKAALFGVLQETVGSIRQGGVYRIPLGFETGVCRARFNPIDGQLYVAGLRGWQTNAVKDGAIQRVRYTGSPVTLPNELHITDQGIAIGFTGPLETSGASDAANYSIEQYNYDWSAAPDSAEYKVSNPKMRGRDKLRVRSVAVASDKKSIFLEVLGLQPVMQMRIRLKIKAADGSPIPSEIANTVNIVPPKEKSGGTYRSTPSAR